MTEWDAIWYNSDLDQAGVGSRIVANWHANGLRVTVKCVERTNRVFQAASRADAEWRAMPGHSPSPRGGHPDTLTWT